MRYFLILSMCILFGAEIGFAQSESILPKADHHIHIRSSASSSALAKLQKVLNGEEVEPLPPTGAEEVITMLDDGDIEKGVLLSLAYFFGIPDVEFENEYDQVMAENNYIINEVAKYPDRLVAFCSMNPLAEYAIKEIRRCANKQEVRGLKLHFANSNIDLRNDDHVQQLVSIFKEAEQLNMAIAVHLFTRNADYGYKDAKIFIDHILTKVPDLKVQIAHMGGPGVYNETTADVLRAFEEAVDQKSAVMDQDIVFDLSATVRNPDTALAQGDTLKANQIRENNQQLVQKIVSIGADRVVFGTDWIGGSRESGDYAEIFNSLSPNEKMIRKIFDFAPYLQK